MALTAEQVSGTASGATSAHPNHFSIGQGGHAGHDFQQKMLGVRAYRQQLLASNIANADTPGYKAVDIDIKRPPKSSKVHRDRCHWQPPLPAICQGACRHHRSR
jgi:hypothetical protein